MWMQIIKGLQEIMSRGERGALATVVKCIGSTPRHEGSKMLIFIDGRAIGTVGGGAPENAVFKSAKDVIRTGKSQTVVMRLTEKGSPQAMLCGGEMHIFVEPVGEVVLYIFGGGHVTLALARLCELLHISHVVLGSDKELVSRDRYPTAKEIHVAPLGRILKDLKLPHSAGVVIATRSALEDERVLAWAVKKDLLYLGLLGSETKKKKLIAKLKLEGITPAKLVNINCPAGMDIGAETPEEIALSIMTEFISVLRNA